MRCLRVPDVLKGLKQVCGDFPWRALKLDRLVIVAITPNIRQSLVFDGRIVQRYDAQVTFDDVRFIRCGLQVEEPDLTQIRVESRVLHLMRIAGIWLSSCKC
jgi:hypothetical protein